MLDEDGISEYEITKDFIIFKSESIKKSYPIAEFKKDSDGVFNYKSGSNYLSILPKNKKILIAMGQLWIVYRLKE